MRMDRVAPEKTELLRPSFHPPIFAEIGGSMHSTTKTNPSDLMAKLKARLNENKPELPREPEFIVGEVGAVFSAGDKIGMEFLPYNLTVGDDLAEHQPITPAQAFMLGTALLQAAKMHGIG